MQIPVTFLSPIASLKQVSRNSSPFWRLVEDEHKRARAYCTRLAGSSDDGDDLYQDSVIKAYRGFNALRNTDSFRPWLYRIINNTYKGRIRNPWWRRVLSVSAEIDNYNPGSDPTSTYDARRRLDYALSSLSVDDRIIVTLSELEGWKISELARLMSKSEGFVKMRLSRARQKMRKRLSVLYRRSAAQIGDKGTEKICCATRPEED